MPKRKRKKQNAILFLVDFENLIINSRREIPPEKFSIEAGFNKVIKELTEEIGKIIGVFAFLPQDRAVVWGKELHELRFNIISCPKIKSKEGSEEDTTDSRLSELGEWLVTHVDDGLTHLCVGSGDRDFSPLLRMAGQRGLKIVIVAADLRSLSSKLIRLADRKPGGEKMVYIFSPTEE